MNLYEVTKAKGIDTLMHGVMSLVLTDDHEECKKLLEIIKQTVDLMLELEDLRIAQESGDYRLIVETIVKYER